jgi:hypothetical protein
MEANILRELTDGQKHDLAMVVCDCQPCLERGEYARCYLETHYKQCEKYKNKKEKIRTTD